MAVELGPLLRDTTVKFYPAVFLANAMAAFILNLVRHTCSTLRGTLLRRLSHLYQVMVLGHVRCRMLLTRSDHDRRRCSC